MTSRQRLGLSALASPLPITQDYFFSTLFLDSYSLFPPQKLNYTWIRDKPLSAQCEYRNLPNKGTKIHLLFWCRVLARPYGLGDCERDCERPGTTHTQKILTSPAREVSHLQSSSNAWGTRLWTNTPQVVPLPNFLTVQLFRSPRVQLLIARARQHRWKRANTN